MGNNGDAYGANALGEFFKQFVAAKQQAAATKRAEDQFYQTLALKKMEMQQAEKDKQYQAFRGLQDDSRALKMAAAKTTTYDPTGRLTGSMGAKLDPATEKAGQEDLINGFQAMYPKSPFLPSAVPQGGMAAAGLAPNTGPSPLLGGFKQPEKIGLPGMFGATPVTNEALKGAGSGAGDSPAILESYAKEKALYTEALKLGKSTMAELDRITPLNEKSYGGLGGALQTKFNSVTNSGQTDPKYVNTVDTVNSLQNLVVKTLKSDFGAQLSDSERDYLNEVKGAAANYTPTQRSIAMTNIRNILRGKISAQYEKVNSLRETYGFKDTIPGSDLPGGAAQIKTPGVESPEVPVAEYTRGTDGKLHRVK